MKNILITFLMTLVSSIVSAQSESVASLFHEGEITSYYGFDAFVNAYKAAADGDVITLSKGTFNYSNIKKSITVRGAGCFQSSLDDIESTIITGGINISAQNITLEGIIFNDNVTISYYDGSSMNNSLIRRCYFKSGISTWGSSYKVFNNFFSNCYFSRLSEVYGENTFISCVARIDNNYSGCFYNFINCILLPYSLGGTNNATFRNCIFINSNSSFDKIYLSSGSTAYNCLSIGGDAGFFSDQVVTSNKVVDLPLSSIFKTYDGSDISFDKRFELTESAAAAYLGGDGTQVGIYGGDFPFTSEVSYPVISKFEASSKTDADGKIKVSVEVKTPQ